MQLFKKDRVFILFTDRTIRYLTWSNSKVNQVSDYGELILDSLIIEDGRLVNLELLTSILTNLIKQKNWKRRKLSFIVPANFVTIRQESIPKQLSREEAISYIKLHLEGSIRLPIKDPIIDFYLLEEGEEQNNILLFAYPSERLKPFHQLFEQLALQPDIADISYLTVYRAYLKADLPNQDEHLLMVQWNKYELVLTVFHQHIPKFNRQIDFSSAPQDWKKSEDGKELIWHSSTPTLAEFIEEQLLPIERLMDFYQYSIMNDKGQIDQILLTGDFPKQAVLEQQLKDRFDLPVKKIDLPNDLPPEYTSLYGLGLRGEHFDL
ncbi:type IV pilus biogenesis protein PilM [Amphibacillus sp. Q70]|uniref:type IV pilus biogenesis protein PilM n=1 Tax=Amphibacillus sp. Q70 TaxID=3453416 RepID=UPI003F854997